MYPDEPLSWLVPDSLSDYHYYLLYLVLSTFCIVA